MWNLLGQYNNIYASSYKYLKEKIKHKPMTKKKKNKTKTIAIVATMYIEQT